MDFSYTGRAKIEYVLCHFLNGVCLLFINLDLYILIHHTSIVINSQPIKLH